MPVPDLWRSPRNPGGALYRGGARSAASERPDEGVTGDILLRSGWGTAHDGADEAVQEAVQLGVRQRSPGRGRLIGVLSPTNKP